MRYRVAAVSLALLVGLGTVQAAEAQRRRGLVDVTPRGDRHGFWLNLGLGAVMAAPR